MPLEMKAGLLQVTAGEERERLDWLELLQRQGERAALLGRESCTVGERESCKRKERKELLCLRRERTTVGERERAGEKMAERERRSSKTRKMKR